MSKLTKLAKGRDCTVMLDGVCNRNPETTVLAHLNDKRLFRCGMGQKVPDWAGAFCCYNCHEVLDGRVTHPHLTYEEVKIAHFEGVMRTQKILVDEEKLWIS